MRIIGGKYRSRRIQVPPNLKARPTTDFAREGIFNVLGNLLVWEETSALDLFSGTGSIAFELVSRGSPRVVCVEQNQSHFDFICRSKEVLGAKELFPVRADAFRYLHSLKLPFDFIFADPPYDLPDMEKIPDIVLQRQLVCGGGFFVLEHSGKHSFSHFPCFREERRYGNVRFSLFAY
ncbi:MAG: RsmD family RNA methyltransferase [Proteiniphilum sp.]|jgi:16S rRNA (guanine(966)-N(2))-methyltransferase RsmD|nr:RsmD family RNA methyltransferase [Proteiniphilum sp.]